MNLITNILQPPFRHDEIERKKKDNKDYGFFVKMNQCVITVINNYVRLRKFGIGTQKLNFHNYQIYR